MAKTATEFDLSKGIESEKYYYYGKVRHLKINFPWQDVTIDNLILWLCVKQISPWFCHVTFYSAVGHMSCVFVVLGYFDSSTQCTFQYSAILDQSPF